MNGYERVQNFVYGRGVDRPPFMPLVIEWVSKKCGLDYYDFVYKPEVRAEAYLKIARQFDLDCILPDADFSEQLEDFGQKPEWVNGKFRVKPIIQDVEDVDDLVIPEIKPGTRQGNRIEILKKVAAAEKGNRYIFGICIGPFTEYCNARGMEDAMCDISDEDDLETALRGIRIFFENGMNFIRAQLAAGADGIQIVEPSCSLISPAFYEEHILPLHKQMVELVQADGGFARLHICGDTTRLIPYSLSTGTHILDVDFAVDLPASVQHLKDGQCFCGNLHTANQLLFAKPEDYATSVPTCFNSANGRIILAAGCDVPPDTSEENMHAFHDAVVALGEQPAVR